MASIFWLDQINPGDAARVGGKAANLARLYQAGLPVPYAFCLVPDWAERRGEGAEAGGAAISDGAATNTIPADGATASSELDEAWQRLAGFEQPGTLGSQVAVRSSAAGEDSQTASYAGQFETFLNVSGGPALHEAVQGCLEAANTARVHSYQAGRGLPAGGSGMAVLVQRQVDAAVSGVLFTRDPLSGEASRLLVEATPGTGEALVAGRVAPAQVALDRQGQALSTAGPELLGPAECQALARLAAQVEELLGPGQDIEWAIAGSQVYLLQARPIGAHRVGAYPVGGRPAGGRQPGLESSPQAGREATLQARPQPPYPLSQIWTRANVGEVLPHAVTPLTWAVFQATLQGQPELIWQNGTDGDGFSLPAGRNAGVRRLAGRVWIRLDALLDSFCYLPGVTPQVMEQVLGVDLPETAAGYTRPDGPAVRLARALFFMDAFGLAPYLAWLELQLPPQPPAGGLEGLLAWTSGCFRLHLKVTGYAIAAFGVLAGRLAAWLPEEAGERLAAIAGRDLSLGKDDLQTVAQGRELWRLAEGLRDDPGLLALVQTAQDWPEVIRQAGSLPTGRRFLASIKAFLAANGARTAGEFELAVPRWREEPAFVLEVLRKNLAALAAAPTETAPKTALPAAAAGRPPRAAAIRQVQAALTPRQRLFFNRMLAAYTRYATLRENVKYRLMEGYALLRQAFLEQGRNLAQAGVLAAEEDVFFLTPAEIRGLEPQMAPGDREIDQVRRTVAARRTQREHWEAQVTPEWVTGDGRPLVSGALSGSAPAAALAAGDPDEAGLPALTGIACSPGVVEGRARVLHDLAQAAMLLPGEILVAPHTDPGWTPLFLSCRAVVTEIGGFLSHGATVAREYGIPCVVNVRGATAHIQSGDPIRVDGTRGRVILLKGHTSE